MKRLLILVLFVIAVGLTYTSLTPHNSVFLLVSVVMGLIFLSLLIAFLSVPWHSGTTIERFKKGLKTGLVLSSGSYILGYFFILLESLLR